MRHRRIIAYILIASLSLGVFTSGLFVMSHYAKADQPSSDDTISFSEIMTFLGTTGAFTQEQLQAFDDYVRPKISDTEENENYIVCVIEDHGSYAISLFMKDSRVAWVTSGLLYGSYELGSSRPIANCNCVASLRYVPEYPQYNFCQIQQNLVTATYLRLSSAYNFSISGTDKYLCMGTPYDFAVSGRHCYWSKDVPAGTFNWGTSFSYIKNLTIDPPGPVGFNLAKFQIGVQTFLTIEDQSFMYAYKDYSAVNMDGAASWVSMLYFNDTDEDPIGIQLLWHDVIPIRDIGFYNSDLTDIAEDGVGYAWKVDPEWFAVYSFNIYYKLSGSDPINTARAINIPFYIEPVDYDIAADDALQDAWQQFNTYVENYNTTHVIPEQLADWLFETNGSKLFPVTVSVPGNIWLPDHGTAYTQHNWVWGGLNAATEAFAYDLFDVCICGSNNLNLTLERNYQLRYFVDDILDPMYNNVSTISFSELLDGFDVVIIVPEDEGYLHDLALTSNIAYCGSSGNSIVYQGTAITGNNLTGFAIVTERGISKQQLWNFNDGITKLYDLQVKYIDSEDKWKDSFLLWSASIFDMLNTLDGRLSSINDILSSWHFEQWFSDLSLKLDRLIDNTSEEEGNYWYLALWNWVTQFKPSENNFVNALNNYDNNWDSFPELPEPTVLPLLPGD